MSQIHLRLVGMLVALAAASTTVLYDCHVSIQERLKRVPMPVYLAPQALCLAVLCGVVAVIAYCFTNGSGSTTVDAVLGMHQRNDYLRGLCVGLMVLVLIRSKLSSIKGAEIGGELVYNTGRVWVMRTVNQRWRTFKAEFYERNKTKLLAIPEYDDRAIEELRETIKTQPEEYREFVETQIGNIKRSRPVNAFDAGALPWQTYYRTVTNLALDYGGQTTFAGWTDCK